MALHSQKQLVQWAVYATVEFYACMLSSWLGCNFCTAYVQRNGRGTYTVLNQLNLVWVRLIQQLIHSSSWMGHGRSYHFYQFFFQNNFNHSILFSNRSHTSNVWQKSFFAQSFCVREKLGSPEAPCIGAAPSKMFHLPAVCREWNCRAFRS